MKSIIIPQTITPPIIQGEQLPNGKISDQCRLVEGVDLICWIVAMGGLKRFKISIEAGFLFDGASIPKIAKSFTHGSFYPPYFFAALIHDFLYHYNLLPRKACDDIFLDILLKSGVKKYRAYYMYRMVRLFGSKAYKADVHKLPVGYAFNGDY